MVVDSGSTDGSLERARAAGATVHEIPPEQFGHGRTRNLGVELARGETVVFTSQDAVADDADWLARLVGGGTLGAGRRGGVRPPAPAPRRPSARALLPRLPLRARAARAAPRAWRRAHVRGDALLERQRRDPARDPRALPVPRRPHDERGPGVVAPRPPRRLRARVRAACGGLPFARVHRALGVPSVLRLGRVGGARLRRGRRVARGPPARGRRDMPKRKLAWLWGSGRRRWIPYTVVYELGKFAGLQLGLRHHRLPRSVVRRLGSYDTG